MDSVTFSTSTTISDLNKDIEKYVSDLKEKEKELEQYKALNVANLRDKEDSLQVMMNLCIHI
jgi:uncharacterized protein YpmS